MVDTTNGEIVPVVRAHQESRFRVANSETGQTVLDTPCSGSSLCATTPDSRKAFPVKYSSLSAAPDTLDPVGTAEIVPYISFGLILRSEERRVGKECRSR